MNKVTNDQISVLCNLSIDNSLILAEAYDDPILCMDNEFINKMSLLIEFSKQIIINVENNNFIDFIDLNRLVLKLMFKAEEIRDTYSKSSIGYPYFNSIYDRTHEAFVELANTL